MRVLVIENYPKTTLGLVGVALAEAGVECLLVQAHAGDRIPMTAEDYDALIMLGGAQDALDDSGHPYLPAEVALARRFGDAGRPVLGICLGAQLLARAYGGRNILGRPIEFGWREVRTTPEGRRDPVLSAMGSAAPLFHWHVDTFTLPPGATRLAESDQTAIQAFRLDRAVYGIQFHFEAGTELVASWTRDFAEELEESVPDWKGLHPTEAARHGEAADAAGLALARAWVALIRPASQIASGAATDAAKRELAEGLA